MAQTSLSASFSVIQIAMLPVEPRVSEFMGEDISPSCDRESLADIDRLGFVVPNSIGIHVLPVHFRISDQPNHNVIAEWQDDFMWYSHRSLTV